MNLIAFLAYFFEKKRLLYLSVRSTKDFDSFRDSLILLNIIF